MGEQEDHRDVDDGRDTEGEGEALNATNGEQVENHGRNQVDGVGDQDGALCAIPALFDGSAERTSISDLVSNTFEVDDERVGGHANCHD